MTWMRTKPTSVRPGGAPHTAEEGVIAGRGRAEADAVTGTDAGRGERVVGWLRGPGSAGFLLFRCSRPRRY